MVVISPLPKVTQYLTRALLGFVFSPDGKHAYVTDTGVKKGLRGTDSLAPATM